jgi:alkylhydroperoxidase/carboxymuconolactone decarboxylase family protein YurZ
MTKEELEEAILTLMIYVGHARATEAIEVAREVFRERGLL